MSKSVFHLLFSTNSTNYKISNLFCSRLVMGIFSTAVLGSLAFTEKVRDQLMDLGCRVDTYPVLKIRKRKIRLPDLFPDASGRSIAISGK